MATDIDWNLDPGTLGGPNISGTDPAAAQNDVYGTDVLYTDDVQVSAKGDLATIDGIDNLRRSILRRLLVRPGEYKLNPQYGAGVPSYVKKGQTKANLDELQHAIVDQLSRERRIDKVLAITVSATMFDQQPGIIVSIQVLAIGRNISFEPFSFNSTGTA